MPRRRDAIQQTGVSEVAKLLESFQTLGDRVPDNLGKSLEVRFTLCDTRPRVWG